MNHTYTLDDLKDVLICAIEGGIGYWSVVHSYKPDKCYAKITEMDDDGNPIKTHEITASVIRKGIKILLSDEADVRDDIAVTIWQKDNDSESADCIVQAGLFGKVIYG